MVVKELIYNLGRLNDNDADIMSFEPLFQDESVLEESVHCNSECSDEEMDFQFDNKVHNT